MSTNTISTAHSEAEKRSITVTTTTGDPIVYSNNPAELPGVRYEINRCLYRVGAFELLYKHNACRLSNGAIAVESFSNIPFIIGTAVDPNIGNYDFNNPCPPGDQRLAAYNAALPQGEPQIVAPQTINEMTANQLKIAFPAPHEVAIEDHAYALTQLAPFADRKKAAELLEQCNRSGRRLVAILDAIEQTATGEDFTLVTGRRDQIESDGLKNVELTLSSYEDFMKRFNKAETMCPRHIAEPTTSSVN